MRRERISLWFLALLMVAWTGAASAAEFKIVVNNSVRVNSLSRKVVSDFFMKRTVKWDSGQTVVPVDQTESAAVRDDFSRVVHGKPTAAVKSYWNHQIFSGRDIPPVEKPSDGDVLAFVRSTPGAVGYVSVNAQSDGVRVVTLE